MYNTCMTLYFLTNKKSVIKNYVCASVCPSVCHGRSAETTWTRGIRGCISGYTALQAKTGQSLCVPVTVLATGTNTSSLDSWYKNQRQQWALTYSGLKLAEQIDSREDIVPVIAQEEGNSVFASWLLKSCERDGEQTNEFIAGRLI